MTIEFIGLAARYGMTLDARDKKLSTPFLRYASLSIEIPDEGVQLLADHDHDRRIGWAWPYVHDEGGLVIRAVVEDPRLVSGLGLSIGARWDYEAEMVIGPGDEMVTVVGRTRLDHISTTPRPRSPGCGMRLWRPVLSAPRVEVRSWFEDADGYVVEYRDGRRVEREMMEAA